MDVPVLSRHLRRVKETGTQTRLDKEMRRANVRDAFAVRDEKCWPASGSCWWTTCLRLARRWTVVLKSCDKKVHWT